MRFRKIDKVCFLGFCMSDKDDLLDLDLPRIVVEEDKIIVLEDNDWAEKNVKGDVYGDLDEEMVEKLLEEMVFFPKGMAVAVDEGRDAVGELEEVVGFVEDKEKVVYDVGMKGADFYDTEKYDAGEDEEGYDFVEEDGNTSEVELAEDRRGDRSMLEIAGFEDLEAEKKRDERRRMMWG